ncbi:hypothetical protein RUR49_06790 [Pseudoxanthobacter sp. M-2]|uniref:hypothetical protein n=1 Tax=Pseudoxanthobacter sp. M-2 TaxID=3078754 RepID=UPI0038FD3886
MDADINAGPYIAAAIIIPKNELFPTMIAPASTVAHMDTHIETISREAIEKIIGANAARSAPTVITRPTMPPTIPVSLSP